MDRIYRTPLCTIWHYIEDKNKTRALTNPQTVELKATPCSYALGYTPLPPECYLAFPNDLPYGALAKGIMLGAINKGAAHERVHYAENDAETHDYTHAVYKEFRAELKGLDLWKRHSTREYDHIMHGLCATYIHNGPTESEDIHPRAYETLLCTALYEGNPDLTIDEWLYNFIPKRSLYQKAAHECCFLAAFTQRYCKSYAGTLAHKLSNPPYIDRGSRERTSDRYLTYLEYRIGKVLCRIFNSRLLWDTRTFKEALHQDTKRVKQFVDEHA